MTKIENYIDGKLAGPRSDSYLENVNPATGEVYSHIPDSDASDVELAVKAAKCAFRDWSQTPAELRHDVLMRVSGLIEENLDELAAAESIDNGKPLTLAKTVDIPRAVSNFMFYATAAMHTASRWRSCPMTRCGWTARSTPRGSGC